MQPPTTIRRRLNELEVRRRLRERPRVQGRILAPAGMFRRLPKAPGLYFPFYHDVPQEYGRDLRRHLKAFRSIGPLVPGDEALLILAGRKPLAGPVFCLSFDDAHLTWRDVAAPILFDLNVPATFFVTTGLISTPGNLTWEDVRELSHAGFALGSHTVTHHRLADQDDITAAREMLDSKHEIEDQAGVAVRDFAAPYGNPAVDYRQCDVIAARGAGYPSVAGTRRDAMRVGDSSMSINRQ